MDEEIAGDDIAGDDIAVGISRYFAELPDPRRDHTRRHKLTDIVVMAICAVICGAEDYEAMAEYAQAREAWFRTFLELPGGIPAHDTFWRVFRALDAQQFERCFSQWTASLRRLFAGEVIAVDGKQLRRSRDRTHDGSSEGCGGVPPVHLISAWATRNGLLLGQLRQEAKENEIVAVPELLAQLHLDGCLVTADAMNCQVKTAQTIVERKGDYLLALKANQPALYDETVQLFDDLAASGGTAYVHSHAKEVSSGHGRIETRQAWVISDPKWLRLVPSTLRWPRLTALVKLTSERRLQATGEVSHENRYYITSATLAAADAITATRAHWQIENSLHWVLDVAFREDESRVRKDNGAENFAVLRRMALSVLKRDTTLKLGVKNKRLNAGWDHAYLLRLLRLLIQPDRSTPT